MENLNKEYMERFHNYIVAMVYFENLLKKEEITIDDYIEIERNIAHKYNMEESIFRMKKRACDYGKKIEVVVNDEEIK